VGTLAFVFSSGWASGLNCYLVVLVLGIADRVHDTDQVPNVLQRPSAPPPAPWSAS
jgi:hypothetical protein